jgi:hypothetical protein
MRTKRFHAEWHVRQPSFSITRPFLVAEQHAPLSFGGLALPRQFRKLAEARNYGHDNPSVIALAVDVTGV